MTAQKKLVDTRIMMDFMEDLNSETLADAAKPLPVTESKVEQIENEDAAAYRASIRLKKIKRWDEVGDNFTQEDKVAVIRDHKEKLARYRRRKDWEAWIEEDELDIEGDRLLSEIKNYKSEYFFNTGFYI